MTAALSQWVKCYWIKFILNCTESKLSGFTCDSCQTTLTFFWHQSRSVVPGNLRGSNLNFFVRRHGRSSAKASVAMIFWLLVCFWVIVLFSWVSTCVFTKLCVCFPLRAISEGQRASNLEPNLSQRVWRHDTTRACFSFCKIEFCCKMHMQEFCTEVTILP